MSIAVQAKASACFRNISISPDVYSADKFPPIEMVGWVAIMWCLKDLLLCWSALDFFSSQADRSFEIWCLEMTPSSRVGSYGSSILRHSCRVSFLVVTIAIPLVVGNFIIVWIVEAIAPKLLRPVWSRISGRLGCRVPWMAPNVEVNLCGLLELDKSDLSGDKDQVQLELITPDLICPLTYQLLHSSSGDSGPELSFDKSASPEWETIPHHEVTKILPDKFVRSATPVFSVPPIVSEALDQAYVDHGTDGSPPIV
ncbi:hypothetical protein Tco_1002011 [Tanacetum coccineum]|uniref:Uncharacterized protein n=1 Tax=Tanacetum coccineum TaxID=301880 RepID=A0ABQ5F5R5_9ASTR